MQLVKICSSYSVYAKTSIIWFPHMIIDPNHRDSERDNFLLPSTWQPSGLNWCHT